MNDIEKLNSVKFNIRKALESQGSDITVDTPFEEYPSYIMKMSGGGGTPEAEEKVFLEEQTVTGIKPAPEVPVYIASLGGEFSERPSLRVYYDGKRYDTELDYESMTYGAPIVDGKPDFSEIPFNLNFSKGANAWVIGMKDGDPHTVKVVVLVEAVYPYGNLEITENGLLYVDVKEYESVSTNIPEKAEKFGKVRITTGNLGFAITISSIAGKNKIESKTAQYQTPATINVTYSGSVYDSDEQGKADGTFMVTVPDSSPTIKFTKQTSGGTLKYAKVDDTTYLVYVVGISKLNPAGITVLLDQ